MGQSFPQLPKTKIFQHLSHHHWLQNPVGIELVEETSGVSSSFP